MLKTVSPEYTEKKYNTLYVKRKENTKVQKLAYSHDIFCAQQQN